MFDSKELRKAVLGREGAAKQTDKAKRWRLVPVGYLVECVEERAAIIQHDGGLSRDYAEREAFAQGEQRFRVYELIAE